MVFVELLASFYVLPEPITVSAHAPVEVFLAVVILYVEKHIGPSGDVTVIESNLLIESSFVAQLVFLQLLARFR